MTVNHLAGISAAYRLPAEDFAPGVMTLQLVGARAGKAGNDAPPTNE